MCRKAARHTSDNAYTDKNHQAEDVVATWFHAPACAGL
jgi:hypothetical protein